MGEPSPPRANPAAWVMATILLLICVGGSFWVPLYARSAPKLGDFPFFYWYQLIWVPVVAILSWICFLLVKDRRRAPDRARTSPDGGRDDQAGSR
jgi:cytochrome bd-type quinol oxidase subunit 2